jgi:hypothetical protein
VNYYRLYGGFYNMIKNTERQLMTDLANYLIKGLNYEEMMELYSTIRSKNKDSKTIGDIYIWRFIDDKASYSLLLITKGDYTLSYDGITIQVNAKYISTSNVKRKILIIPREMLNYLFAGLLKEVETTIIVEQSKIKLLWELLLQEIDGNIEEGVIFQ